MTTLAILRARILDDLERSGSDWNTRVDAEIATAINHYQSKRFYFNESRDVTFNTVASTGIYSFDTIGTVFNSIDAAYVTDGANIYQLLMQDYRAFETLIGTSAAESRPTDFAYISRSLRLWPTPDAAYSVRLTGHIEIAAPATDEEADNPWMTEAFELLRCRAKAYLAAHVLEDDTLAGRMLAAERIAYDALKTESASRVGTGHVTPSQF